jgi:hypothetical protein
MRMRKRDIERMRDGRVKQTGERGLEEWADFIRYRFAYCILAADELVAVTNTVKFRYDDGTTFLSWVVGENVDPAVWIALFLVLVTCINLFPVKVCLIPTVHL